VRLFRRRQASREDDGLGLFLFDDVASAIRAESVLKPAGYEAALVAPPPLLRAGCDLAVSLPRVERPGAERLLLRSETPFERWVDTTRGKSEIVDVVTTVDFGDWVMVRAGNMKMTVAKGTGRIVNTSGGGCPDIPYLNKELVGKVVWEAPRPKDIGYTLCGLMLDRAQTECMKILSEERSGPKGTA